MGCLTRFIQSSADARVVNASNKNIQSLLQPLVNSPHLQESASILLDFEKMVFNSNGSSALTVLRNAGEVPESMDKFIQLYTNGIYKNTETLIKESATDPKAMELLRTVGRKSVDTLNKFAAYREDFQSSKDDENFSDFHRIYNSFLNKNKMTTFGAGILGSKFLREHSSMIANKGPLDAMDSEMFNLSKEYIGINNSIKTFNNELNSILDNLYKRHNISGYLDSNLIDKFVNKTSGIDYIQSKKIAEETVAEEIELGAIKNPNMLDRDQIISTVSKNMLSFKKEFDFINFGYDIEKLENDSKAMLPDEKIQYRNKILSDINNLKLVTTKDGEGAPPIFWMIMQTSQRLSDMVAKKKSLGMNLEDVENRFLEFFNKENPKFTARTYYVPSEMEDLLGFSSLTGVGLRITSIPNFMKEKGSSPDTGESGLQVKLMNNMKKFQSTMEKLSTYSVSTLKNKIIDSRYEQNLVPESMDTAFQILRSENQKQIDKSTSESLDKQYSKGTMIAKQIAGAYVSLAAGSLLTASAVNNYIGGGIGILASLGFKDGIRIIGQYKNAAKSTDTVSQQVRKLIDFRLNYINPISNKSDMILANVATDSRMLGALNRVTDSINKTGDWLLSKGFVQWLTGFKELAFNRSEHNLSKIQNAILYDRVLSYVKSSVEDNKIKVLESDDNTGMKVTKEFQDTFDKAMTLFENDSRQKGYEAIGQFDTTAKPLAFNIMKDAEDVFGVIKGVFFLTMSMFKQVEHVNAGIINRQLASIFNKANLNLNGFKANLQSLNNPAALSGSIGIVVASFYEWLADEYGFLPQIYGGYNANPSKLPTDAAKAAYAYYSMFSGEPVSDGMIRSSVDVLRFAGGIGFGSALSEEAGIKNFIDTNPLSPFIKRWAKAQDIESSYYKLMSESLIPWDKPSDMFTYRSELKASRMQSFWTEDDRFNLNSLPLLSVVPVIGSNNKVSKIMSDVGTLLNSLISKQSLPDDKGYLATNNIGKDLVQLGKDLTGLSVFMPYETIDKQKSYDYSQEYRLRRTEWERDFHGYPQSRNFYSSARANHSRIIRITSKQDNYLMHPEYALDRIPPKPFVRRSK